mmetsp:Transcript_55958/g.177294  ORF Transcript_55958/g.177294 Transcript_55958/m.177294 type:complete len:315 (+) Transcript_55958:151-1095(+)
MHAVRAALRISGAPAVRGVSRAFQTATGEAANASASVGGPAEHAVPRPTWAQLRSHAMRCAVPMVGFGFMDNTVMIHAGNAIDLTLGVTFGLSTLTAACMGQMCSDVAGLCFGDTVEGFVNRRMRMPAAHLTAAQKGLRLVRNVGLAGQCVGVVFGCALGMVNLLFIDTDLSTQLKGLGGSDMGGFEVSLSNEGGTEGHTAIIIKGVDRPGILASTATAITGLGANVTTAECRVAAENEGDEHHRVSILYTVTKDGEEIEGKYFKEWGEKILEACGAPGNMLVERNQELQDENAVLHKALAEAGIAIAMPKHVT